MQVRLYYCKFLSWTQKMMLIINGLVFKCTIKYKVDVIYPLDTSIQYPGSPDHFAPDIVGGVVPHFSDCSYHLTIWWHTGLHHPLQSCCNLVKLEHVAWTCQQQIFPLWISKKLIFIFFLVIYIGVTRGPLKYADANEKFGTK